MTLFWLGCGLTSLGMHCHAMALAMMTAARRKQIPMEILVPRTANTRATGSLKAQLALTQSVYATNPGGIAARPDFEADIAQRHHVFFADLQRSLAQRVTSNDAVVIATPMASEMAALADWYEQLSKDKRPRVAAYCVLPIGYGIAPGSTWQRAAIEQLYQHSIGRLIDLTAGRFQLFCENRQVFDDLSPFLPNAELRPHIFVRPAEAQPRGRPGMPYVLFIGSVWEARKDKGIDLVLEMLRMDASRETPFDWIVQVAPLYRQPPKGCDCANMHFILDVPSHSDYWSFLSGASLVLLPYDPVAYGDGRGSGIFEEARTVGVPTLCSEAPFFVAQLSQIGEQALMFHPYTASALLEKTNDVMSNIDKYRDRFEALAQAGEDRAGALLDRLMKDPIGGWNHG